MTAARRHSLALLLPEEDTVILLPEKNNTIHHLILSLPPFFHPPSVCFALVRVFLCPSEGTEDAQNPQVRLSSTAEVGLIRSMTGIPEGGVLYPDETLSTFFAS